MPKSEPPRKKNVKDASRVKQGKRLADIINQAQSLDRRRVAQIENQKKSITRLLNLGIDPETDTTTPEARYTEEMRILHEGAAVLTVENEDLRQALRALMAAIDGTPLDGVSWGTDKSRRDALAYALAAARAHVGLNPLTGETFSAPVSESEGGAG